MSNEGKELLITAKYNGADINLTEIEINIHYDGHDAQVDAESAMRRCILLAHENQFLKSALEKALGGHETPKIEIAQMGDIPEASDGR